MFEEEILPRLKALVLVALLIFTMGVFAGFVLGRFCPHCPAAEVLSAQAVPPGRPPPGQPPLPVVAAPDAVLAYALGDLWPYTSARDQAALREMLHPLQSWARDHWPPFPDLDATPACP